MDKRKPHLEDLAGFDNCSPLCGTAADLPGVMRTGTGKPHGPGRVEAALRRVAFADEESSC